MLCTNCNVVWQSLRHRIKECLKEKRRSASSMAGLRDILDHLEELFFGYFDISRQIPSEMFERNDWLEVLQFVPLIPLDRQDVLLGGERSDIPCDVVAPADRLHPMHCPGVDPDQVTRTLEKPVNRNVVGLEVVEDGPPRAVKVIQIVPDWVRLLIASQALQYLLFAHPLDYTPVFVGHSKPLAISGSNVDIDRTEVVVLLVTRCAAAGHFHVELDCVHSENDVPHMTEHVARRHHSGKWGQFHEFLELSLPFLLIWEIHVCSKLHCFEQTVSFAFLHSVMKKINCNFTINL